MRDAMLMGQLSTIYLWLISSHDRLVFLRVYLTIFGGQKVGKKPNFPGGILPQDKRKNPPKIILL